MSDLYELEQQLAGGKEAVERKERVLRLFKNPDFRKVILEEFMIEECARYAQVSADPAMGSVERADALAIAQSAGHLKRYLNIVITIGNQAQGQIEGLEEAIFDARSEEGAN